MRKYRPRLGTAFGCLLLAVLFLGFAVVLVIGFSNRGVPGDPWITVPLITMGALLVGAFGLGLLYEAHFCCAVIETDNEGITRRTLLGTYRLLWRNIARFETTGTSQDDYDLWDHNGRRLDVNPSATVNGGELLGEIESRIAPLREVLLRECRGSGVTLRTVMPLGAGFQAGMALFAPLCLFGAYALLRLPAHDRGEHAVFLIAAAMCGAPGMLFGLLMAHQFTRVVILTPQSICVRSLLYRREIVFSEIESVMSGSLQVNDATQATVAIRSRAGTKLMMSAGSTPNFGVLVALLRERAGEPAITEGARDAGTATRKRERQTAKFLLFASPLYIGMFLGAPFWLLHAGRQRVESYHRIGRKGIAAEATIVDKTTTGSKNTAYILEYRFTPAGASEPIKGASPVEYDVWDRTLPGQKATALYIPGDPHSCRLTISISGRLGETDIRMSWFYFAMGLLGSGLYVTMIVRTRLRAAGKLQDPAMPLHIASLDAARVATLRRELRRVGVARKAGAVVGSAMVACFLVYAVVFMIIGQLNPTVKQLGMQPNPSRWVTVLVLSPLLVGAAAYYFGVPLGEFFARLKLRQLGDELAHPQLAGDLVTALQQSTATEKSLAGPASLRMLNALTVACKDAESIDLTSSQRHFLYDLLRKWQDDEKRMPFSLAVLRCIPAWRDPAGIAAATAIATTSSLEDVRTAAASAKEAAATRHPGNP